MKDVTLLELLKSGAHFGHNSSRWNPKMKPYIFGVRNHIHILDLEATKKHLLKAQEFAKKLASQGGTILFVGTKKQSRDSVKKAALACGMPYIDVRWLGGTFTNFKTIQKTIRKMEKLESLKATGELETRYTKKERLMIEREIEGLKKIFEGIRDLRRLPEAIFVTDVKHESIAIKEAIKSKIKIIALVDSNSDFKGIDYIIPCNDDSKHALQLMSEAIADAINEGKGARPELKPNPETTKAETK